MDHDSWFEVTPANVAAHIAGRLAHARVRTVVDATCGVAANVIAFAEAGMDVVGVDLDPQRVAAAAANCRIYGVRAQLKCSDFCAYAASAPPADAVFLSPPWGGPDHLQRAAFSLRDVDRWERNDLKSRLAIPNIFLPDLAK